MTARIIEIYLKNVRERMTGDPVTDNEIMLQAYKLLEFILNIK